MDRWMTEFDAEVGNRSNAEAVAYFNGEKEKLRKMDTLYREVLATSTEYLERFPADQK